MIRDLDDDPAIADYELQSLVLMVQETDLI